MNKERDKQRMIRDLQGVALTIGNIAERLIDAGFGYLPDRVEGQTVSAELVRFLNGEAPLDGKWFGDGWAPRFWWRKYLPKLDAATLTAPHPVEGELTRECPYCSPDGTQHSGGGDGVVCSHCGGSHELPVPQWSEVKEKHNNMDGMNEWVPREEAEQALISVRGEVVAATEARVRGECEGVIAGYSDRIDEQGVTIFELEKANAMAQDLLKEKNATIADLTAKLEGAVQIPPVEEWGREHYGLAIVWSVMPQDAWADYTTLFRFIPRPTPKPMTNEEKAEAWRKKWLEESPGMTMADANEELLRHLIDGKSIDQLLEEIK